MLWFRWWWGSGEVFGEEIVGGGVNFGDVVEVGVFWEGVVEVGEGGGGGRWRGEGDGCGGGGGSGGVGSDGWCGGGGVWWGGVWWWLVVVVGGFLVGGWNGWNCICCYFGFVYLNLKM